MKFLYYYLKFHYLLALVFCLIANIPGIFIGIPLYGVFQSWILLHALKKEIWKSYPCIHKFDVMYASSLIIIFTIAIILNILYMFYKRLFPSILGLSPCTQLFFFGQWGTIIYITVTLPVLMCIVARKVKSLPSHKSYRKQ